MTNPGSIAKNVAAVFTAPAGATLEAGNTYVVVIDYDKAGATGVYGTRSNNEDATSTTGWTIGNSSLTRLRTDTNWNSASHSVFLRVNGTPVPPPPPPGNLRASPGDGEVALSWEAPASDWVVTRHEYRYKTEGNYGGWTTEGDYGDWTTMPDSGRGENNVSGYTVPRLINGTVYTFQVRAVNGAGAGAAAESDPVTPALPSVVPTTCTLNPGDVWCGTVQVGEVAEASGKTIGYGFHETWHGQGVGYMHDGRINYGANSYRIDEAMVGVGATDRTDGFLFFGLNRAFPSADRARLALHVGSDRFPLSEAHFESSTHTYHWRNTGLDWSSTASVTPRLRASPAAPTAVTATAPPRTGGLRQAPGRRAIRPHRPPAHGGAAGGGVVGAGLGCGWVDHPLRGEVLEGRRSRKRKPTVPDRAARVRGDEPSALCPPGRVHRVRAAGAGEERHRLGRLVGGGDGAHRGEAADKPDREPGGR